MLEIVEPALITDVDDGKLGVHEKLLGLDNAAVLEVGDNGSIRFPLEKMAEMVFIDKEPLFEILEGDGIHVMGIDVLDDLLDEKTGFGKGWGRLKTVAALMEFQQDAEQITLKEGAKGIFLMGKIEKFGEEEGKAVEGLAAEGKHAVGEILERLEKIGLPLCLEEREEEGLRKVDDETGVTGAGFVVKIVNLMGKDQQKGTFPCFIADVFDKAVIAGGDEQVQFVAVVVVENSRFPGCDDGITAGDEKFGGLL
jgi:hypothetical protein